jgi:hypothetical protein
MTDRPPIIGGLAMIWAYLLAWMRQEEFLADINVVRFIRKTQLQKLVGLLKGQPIHT